MPPDPQARATLEQAGSQCLLCRVALHSKTARYCVACIRKYTRRCPHCLDPVSGRLLSEFTRHKLVKPDKFDVCSRCHQVHDGPFQKECPVCKNSRHVTEMPS